MWRRATRKIRLSHNAAPRESEKCFREQLLLALERMETGIIVCPPHAPRDAEVIASHPRINEQLASDSHSAVLPRPARSEALKCNEIDNGRM